MGFAQFMVVYSIYSLVLWAYNAALPILVVQKFGTGSEVVVSLVLQFLPRIICAPLVGAVLFKIGPKLTAGTAIICLSMGMLILPHIDHYRLFQGTILWTGIVGAAASASLTTLRSCVIPQGKNIAANASFSTVERLSQIIGPAFTGVLLRGFSILYSFYAIALLLLAASIVVLTVDVNLKSTFSNEAAQRLTPSYTSLIHLLHRKPVLRAVFIPALGYAILLGAMNPFLLWSTTQTFHSSENQWTLLLTAHGVGAVVGSFIAPQAINWMSARASMLNIYLWMRLLKGVWLMGLAWVSSFSCALSILMIAGLPEVIGSVCFFALLQKNLSYKQEGLFHTLSFPLFTAFVVLGTSLGGFYTDHWLSLQGFWLLATGLASLFVLPFLFGWHTNGNIQKKQRHC